MAFRPTTNPDTWVPAGAERGETPGAAPKGTAQAPRTAPTQPASRAPGRAPAEGPARRRPLVALPPPAEPRRPHRLRRARARTASIVWVAVAMAIPWTWYLVRDLGPAMQFVSMALPVLVAAGLLGLLISAADSRKVTPLLVAASVAAFGWVSVIGPRSAQPSPVPADPIRIASLSLADTKDLASGLRVVAATRADIRVVVAPSKKQAASIRRAIKAPDTLQSGRFVVFSRYPLSQAPLPKGLPAGLVVRFQVFGPTSTFVVYATRTDAGILAAGMNDPLALERLRTAALHEDFPAILIGDMGMSDRSTEYRAYAASFRDAMRARVGASSTVGSFWSPLLLRIDHVFTSTTWCAAGSRTFDVPGSDQRGLIASVGPCRG